MSSGSPILLLFVFFIATKRSSLLLSNGATTVDCFTSKICLPKCFSAMDVRFGTTIPALRRHVTLLPSYGCSSRIAYRFITVPSFPRFLLRDVFLWLGISHGDHSPTATTAPSLMALVPSDTLTRFQSVLVHHHYAKFLFSNGGGKTIPSGQCCLISCSF
jgi:hypothetical protein